MKQGETLHARGGARATLVVAANEPRADAAGPSHSQQDMTMAAAGAADHGGTAGGAGTVQHASHAGFLQLPHPIASRSSGPEFSRGAAAAITNILVTFPLNKLISRQAYEGLTITQAARTVHQDGMGNLYRGITPPLLQKSIALGVMYGGYDWYYHQLVFATTGRTEHRAATDVPHWEDRALRSAAAILAGTTECALAPFERIQTILQHRHYTEAFANTMDVAQKLRPYGLAEFYRGVSAIMLRNGPSNALFFALREPVKAAIHFPAPPPPPPPPTGLGSVASGPAAAEEALWRALSVEFTRDFASGAILGAGISTLFYPLNICKSVMQLRIGGRHRGVLETMREVTRERGGLAGLYRGVSVNAVRSLLSWGLINSSYEVYKRWI